MDSGCILVIARELQHHVFIQDFVGSSWIPGGFRVDFRYLPVQGIEVEYSVHSTPIPGHILFPIFQAIFEGALH